MSWYAPFQAVGRDVGLLNLLIVVNNYRNSVVAYNLIPIMSYESF